MNSITSLLSYIPCRSFCRRRKSSQGNHGYKYSGGVDLLNDILFWPMTYLKESIFGEVFTTDNFHDVKYWEAIILVLVLVVGIVFLTLNILVNFVWGFLSFGILWNKEMKELLFRGSIDIIKESNAEMEQKMKESEKRIDEIKTQNEKLKRKLTIKNRVISTEVFELIRLLN